MKKLLCMVLAIVLVFSLVLSFSYAESAILWNGSNIILNGDFEKVTDESVPDNFLVWTDKPEDQKVFFSSEVSHGGKNSFMIDQTAGSARQTFGLYIYNGINTASSPLKSGKTYNVSCWVKGENIEGVTKIGIDFYQGPAWKGNLIPDDCWFAGTFDWKKVTFDFQIDVPVENGADIFRFMMLSDPNMTGKFYVDDVSISEVISYKQGDNIVQNGSFEVAIDGKNPDNFIVWTDKPEDQEKYVTTEAKHSGDAAFIINQSAGSARQTFGLYVLTGINSETSPLKKGKTYKATAWVKGDNVEGATKFGIDFYKGSEWKGNLIPDDCWFSGSFDWKQVSFEFQIDVPVDNGADVFRLMMLSDPNMTGKLYVDDVSIVELVEEKAPTADTASKSEETKAQNDSGENPKTGDSSMVFMVALMVAAAISTAVLAKKCAFNR